ncbi:MAG: L-rhamnose isomerase [Lentisphaeria bacterium]|nr:L-rhamnose isomerase [Lentisphaeria bacterium]
MKKDSRIEKSYQIARERYAELGVDTDAALAALAKIPISLHCWQGDDVIGFERDASGASGGILSTGSYPGRARNVAELRADLDRAMALLPGALRLNLHAIYLDSEKPVERDKLELRHFLSWIDWAKERGIGLDFNPTCFSHPKAATGFTLSSPDASVRRFWIEHVNACRRFAAEFGKQLGKRCVMNIWVPDGFKDTPVDRAAARKRLRDSLDTIFELKLPAKYMRDAVESKLFGIGVESCTVGSHEFYMGYAQRQKLLLCLDSGHFHPTETISDKISSALLFLDEILLHVSRPVRWDSDHVVIWDDELQAIANEIVRNDPRRVNIGLDYFDGTVNRLAAWTVGVRSTQRALCRALLEPAAELRRLERTGDYTRRMMLVEELKALPAAAVYDYFCLRAGRPVGAEIAPEIDDYESKVQKKRR